VVISAAGCVEHDELVEVLLRSGWNVSAGEITSQPAVPPPVAAAPSRRHVEREGHQTHIVLGSPLVGYGDARRYAITLASLMLGGGMSSRLFQRVREELGLAYAVYTFQSYHHDTGMQGIYVGTSPDSAAQALEEIGHELARVAGEGFPPAEIEAGKNQLKGQFTLSLESPSSRMFRVAATELYGEPFLPLDAVLARIDAITADDVAALCAEFLAPERQTVLTLGRTSSA
jgi:predicted Zn-dependent peptidase